MIATAQKCGTCHSLVFRDDHPGWGCARLFCPICSRDSITRAGPPPPVVLRDYSEVEGAVLLLAQILGPDLAAEYVRRTAADDGEFFDPRGGDIIRALARAAVAKQVKESNGHGSAVVGEENGFREGELPLAAGKRGRVKVKDRKGKVKGWAAGPKVKARAAAKDKTAVEPLPESDLALAAEFLALGPVVEVSVAEPEVPAWLTAAPGTEYFQGRQLALI